MNPKLKGNNTPLVLTMMLDGRSASFFNAKRKAHFPVERNFIEAHLTLFHHLPGDEYEVISQKLGQICGNQAPFELKVTGVRMIGKGVAYVLDSKPLISFHHALISQWQHWLTPQDQQKLWPHITVQNKVHPEEARKLHSNLKEQFAAFEAIGVGLQLWSYLGGPWKLLKTWPFEAKTNMRP